MRVSTFDALILLVPNEMEPLFAVVVSEILLDAEMEVARVIELSFVTSNRLNVGAPEARDKAPLLSINTVPVVESVRDGVAVGKLKLPDVELKVIEVGALRRRPVCIPEPFVVRLIVWANTLSIDK